MIVTKIWQHFHAEDRMDFSGDDTDGGCGGGGNSMVVCGVVLVERSSVEVMITVWWRLIGADIGVGGGGVWCGLVELCTTTVRTKTVVTFLLDILHCMSKWNW